ncbi:MAG TPA: ATP-binding protein, partial [Burkholderiales bacterium]|nr:ATP-binding protein [Burkholderiales bacterium]
EVALMLLGDADPDLGQIRSVIEDGKRQALRAGQSIHQLLHLLNKHDVHTEPMDLAQEISKVIFIAITEHELQFHAALRLKEYLPLVRANRTHVQKVLLNLFHNAIEAMDAAGVAHPEIKVSVKQDGGVAQVTIKDSGPGFGPDDIGHLFEPFYTTKVSGIGMGLAISRALIEANGGQLWVDPKDGPGATFHLTLPFSA